MNGTDVNNEKPLASRKANYRVAVTRDKQLAPEGGHSRNDDNDGINVVASLGSYSDEYAFHRSNTKGRFPD
jgi:hypothetical protein